HRRGTPQFHTLSLHDALPISMTDEIESWGGMTLGAASNEPWLQIAKAFEDYDLKPDFHLERQEFRGYQRHDSGGLMPVHEPVPRSEEHTSELQSRSDLVCRLL